MASAETETQDWLLPSLVDHHAQTTPDAVWTQYPISQTSYEEGFRTVTYKDFANAVNGAAHWIERTLGRPGTAHEALAYMGPNDIRYMVFVIAAVKSGYAMLLISPRNSIAAQLNLFEKTGCRKLVTTSPEPPAIQQLKVEANLPVFHVPTVSDLLDQQHPHYSYSDDYHKKKHEPLVVLHTSGSTGLPKPIVYTHEFAASYQRSFINPPPDGYFNMSTLYRGNRMFFMLPPFHAGGVLMHLINAVNNKTTIITPTALTPPTARGLAEALKHVEIDVAFGTPLTCLELNQDPDLLDQIASKLPTFFYAGGDCPKAIGDKINEKLKLFTIVGYTECGSFNQIRPIGPWSNEWKYIQLDPTMNAEFRHLHDDLYQHWYVRKAEVEDKQAPFKLFPELQEYTSQDLFSPHPTKPGLWTHRGRADDIIVFLNGEKTNPVSFETTVARAPEVNTALVVGSQRFQAALLIEPKEPLTTVTARAEALERIWPVIEEANVACPAHARVARSHVLFTRPDLPMPRAGKGTVQRALALNIYREDINKLYDDADKQDQIDSMPLRAVADVTTEELSKTIHQSVVNVTRWSTLEDTDDFFVCGMDSLQVLLLIRKIKATYQCDALAASVVYTNRTVESLSRAIQNLDTMEQASRTEATTRFKQAIEGSVARHCEKMSAFVSKPDSQSSEQRDGRVVLLTGSTGAIGSYLLQELLASPDVKSVFCLNRSANSVDLQKRRNERHGLPTSWDESRAIHLTGNLSQPSFGLGENQFRHIVDGVTEIFHVAWPVNFNQTLESFDPDLSGVVGLIDLSIKSRRSPSITYISSISAVFGVATAGTSDSVPESVFGDPTAPAQTGYAASKHVAERLLAHASEHLGVRSVILRVGQVAGPSAGKGIWASQEWLPSLVISSGTLGALPDSFGGDASLDNQNVDWVPIDILAKVILEVGSSRAGETGTQPAATSVYHLCNPQRNAWAALLPDIQAAVSKAVGREIQVVGFAAWTEQVKAAHRDLLENRTTTNQDGSEIVSTVPAVKLLDFYQGLLHQPLSGNGLAVLETKEAVRESRSLRELGPIQAQLMDTWIDGWFKP